MELVGMQIAVPSRHVLTFVGVVVDTLSEYAPLFPFSITPVQTGSTMPADKRVELFTFNVFVFSS